MALNSRRKLKPNDFARFAQAEPPLFVELARVVCSTGMLPQKELHECWQMAVIVHQAFPEAKRIADLAAGHGLLAWILVLLARKGDRPLPRSAVAVDITRPKSADVLAAAITQQWPELADAVHYVEGSIDAVMAEQGDTLFVAAHACGSLSDRVLMAAIQSRCSLAIMPCCHSLRKQKDSLANLALTCGISASALDRVDAIDAFRIDALKALDYTLHEGFIQREITPFNRIIMGVAPVVFQHLPLARPASPRKRLGEIRAFEQVETLNASDAAATQTLSQRPSREWIRSFDLSFWIMDEASASILVDIFRAQVAASQMDAAVSMHIQILNHYRDPTSQRPACTFRIQMKSSSQAITKANALALRKNLCATLPRNFELRA